MQNLEQVRAITWDGRESFAMVGVYVVDHHGRAVIGMDRRWQIPDDAIVERRPHVVATPPPPEPPPPSPIPVEASLHESTVIPPGGKKSSGRHASSRR
jgi:hypothetical protein